MGQNVEFTRQNVKNISNVHIMNISYIGFQIYLKFEKINYWDLYVVSN